MDGRKMAEHIEDAIYNREEDVKFDGPYVDDITTFEDFGMLTKNKGLVIKMEDGSEFQITIVKSR
jgi:hypothetical protein